MAKHIYPAVFHPNSDGSYTVTFPDLPGCITEGKSQAEALNMAQDALSAWLVCAAETGEQITLPSAAQSISLAPGEFTSLVRADTRDTQAVRRTVSIPRWMDEQVSAMGLSLSRVLQDALGERLNTQV